MKAKCRTMVNQAAGRELSDAEIQRIDDRLTGTMRRLARSEQDWRALSYDQRVERAATVAMQDIRAEAERKVTLAQLQVIKTAATESRIEALMQQQRGGTALDQGRPVSRSIALADDLSHAHQLAEAEQVQALGRLTALLEAVGSGEGSGPGRRLMMWLFDADNPQMTHDVAREIYANGSGITGNKAAQEGAKAWLTTIEELRQRFNAAGGDVGKLEYGYVPQPHDASAVRAAGPDAWAQHVMPLLDRAQYVMEDGRRMDDAELLAVLRGAWDTIQSEGLNKTAPGQFIGEGARANRGSDHRVLHFKDGDAWAAYMQEYGKGSLYDAMRGHLGGMTRSITLVERYGPNPNAQMRLQFDLAERHDGRLLKLGVGVGEMRVDARGMWAVVSGQASTPANELWATAGQMVRNLEVAGKLASTVVRSLPDIATYFITTGYNRLPYWDAIANLGRVAGDAEARQFLAMHGIMASSASRVLDRFTSENLTTSWAGRLANSTMKLSLMNAWNDWLERAFGMTKMHGLGNMAATPWESLTQWDRALLERRQITAADWAIVNRATPDDFKGMKFLTPEAINATGEPDAQIVATKVLALIRDETQHAIIQPDLVTQAARTWNGTQAGTGVGELARATMLFKSFPFAMVTRHWRRMVEAPTVTDGSAPAMGNRLIYAGGLILSTTALGAISVQALQVLRGQDPIDMTGDHALKFWALAFATGGGAGFYGDLITRNSAEDRGAWDAVGKTLGGPVIGDAAELYTLTKGNIDQALAGKETHAGAEALRFVQSRAPWINTWYAKAAVDHTVMHHLQESLSPGYLGKMRRRAEKEWGASYWWQPGATTPDRGPNLGKAVGQGS